MLFRKQVHLFVACILMGIAGCLRAEVTQDNQEVCNTPPFQWNFCLPGYVEHIEGRGIGYDTGYTTIGALVIPNCGGVSPFLDIRSHYFNDGNMAFNIGTGVRIENDRFDKIFGVNVFYDYRASWRRYNQIGLGFEMLGGCSDFFDMWLNFYLPIGNTVHKFCPSVFKYPGGFVAVATKSQKVLKGADISFETALSRFCNFDECNCYDIYFGIGSYFYDGVCENIVGANSWLGLDYCDWFNAEVRLYHDSTFHTIVQGVIGISYPFGTDCGCCQCSYRPVRRQEIIVQDKKHCHFKTNW